MPPSQKTAWGTRTAVPNDVDVVEVNVLSGLRYVPFPLRTSRRNPLKTKCEDRSGSKCQETKMVHTIFRIPYHSPKQTKMAKIPVNTGKFSSLTDYWYHTLADSLRLHVRHGATETLPNATESGSCSTADVTTASQCHQHNRPLSRQHSRPLLRAS